MDSLNICSLNARGLKNKMKRNAIFKELKSKNMDVISFQETYLSAQDLNIIKKELGGTIHFSPAIGRSMGLVNFFSRKIEQDKVDLIYKTDRVLISKIPFNNESMFIINIYSPCNEKEKILFIKNLENIIKQNIPLDQLENIICMGDFNIVRDNTWDVVAGKPHPIRIVNLFNKFIEHMSLHDVWRENNQNIKTYTWSNGKTVSNSARRLDYIFLGNMLTQFSSEQNIQYIGFTDHRLVSIVLTPISQKKGSVIFKINTSLFKDKHYVKLIIDCIENSKIEYSHLNSQLLWEMIKINIRETTQQYSRFFTRMKIDEKIIISERLNSLENEYIRNPTICEELSVLRKKHEILLIEETKATSNRAGIKWIQEGEKNNKHFLGLEKA